VGLTGVCGGITNVGKSSVIAALLAESGLLHDQLSTYRELAPTISIYPHTTLGRIRIPLTAFGKWGAKLDRTYTALFDTPGVESDSSYLQSFIDVEYERAVSLLKLGGFQRPADKMIPGTFNQRHPPSLFLPISL
jgi:ribosome biogenesis GTPase A